jgi:hypothetical protein
MRTRQTLFPNRAQGFALAASEAPVYLNGMKVIFDEVVPLYPVELESDATPPKPGASHGDRRHSEHQSRRRSRRS